MRGADGEKDAVTVEPFIPKDTPFGSLSTIEWALLYLYQALLRIPRFETARLYGTLSVDWQQTGNSGDGILTVTITKSANVVHAASI